MHACVVARTDKYIRRGSITNIAYYFFQVRRTYLRSSAGSLDLFRQTVIHVSSVTMFCPGI